jgi:hypothetical protein
MNALRRQVRDEGNCVRATGGGKEACDRVRKRRVCLAPPGRDHVKAALVTNRNILRGRIGQASEHNITKPSPGN